MKKKFNLITILMVFIIGFMIGILTNPVKASQVPEVSNVQRYSVDVQNVYANGRTYTVLTSSAPSMFVVGSR